MAHDKGADQNSEEERLDDMAIIEVGEEYEDDEDGQQRGSGVVNPNDIDFEDVQ